MICAAYMEDSAAAPATVVDWAAGCAVAEAAGGEEARHSDDTRLHEGPPPSDKSFTNAGVYADPRGPGSFWAAFSQSVLLWLARMTHARHDLVRHFDGSIPGLQKKTLMGQSRGEAGTSPGQASRVACPVRALSRNPDLSHW